LIVHVDDLLVAHNGGAYAKGFVDRLLKRYPFGTWENVAASDKGVVYCGRTIQVTQIDGVAEARVHQQDFAETRLEECHLDPGRRKDKEDVATPLERSEFKSALGSGQWLVSMTRPDVAFRLHALQRCQAQPRVRHIMALNKLIREVQATAATAIRIRAVRNPVVLAFGDSALWNSAGEEVPGETLAELTEAELLKVFSQYGVVVVIVDAGDEQSADSIPCTVVDWKTQANKRVVTSTFAAETGACQLALAYGKYIQALLADVLNGPDPECPERSQTEIPLRVMTDCRSLYDNLCKEGSLPSCRWTAIHIAALRQQLSAGPGRDESKATLLWVPSREQQADGMTKDGLSEKMREFLARSTVKLHEASAQAIRRQGAQSTKILDQC